MIENPLNFILIYKYFFIYELTRQRATNERPTAEDIAVLIRVSVIDIVPAAVHRADLPIEMLGLVDAVH